MLKVASDYMYMHWQDEIDDVIFHLHHSTSHMTLNEMYRGTCS